MYDKKAMICKLIGAKIAYYRNISGLTQGSLAKRSHISKSTLSRIERGNYNQSVTISVLIDIADALHIDLQLLMSFSDEEKRLYRHDL